MDLIEKKYNRGFIALFCSLVAGVFLGELGSMMMPFQIGALIDGLDLGEAAAGLLGSAETVTIGCCMLAVALGATRMPPRKMAVCGAVIAGSGQLLTVLTDIFSLILIFRIAVGLGSALCLSAALKTIASFKNPESLTGHVYAYVILILALIIYLVPWILSWGYHRTLFSLFAALTFLGMVLLFRLPTAQSRQPQIFKSSTGKYLHRLIAVFLIGEFLFLSGVGTVWSFIERIGLSLEMTSYEVGLYLSLGMLVSVIGSFAAGFIGLRAGRILPLAGGTALTAAASGLIPVSTSVVSYLIVMFIFQFMLSFVLPYVIGTAASIDRSGRLATAAFAVQVFSYGSGSAIGGHVVEHFSLKSLGIIGFAGPVLAACFFFIVCRMLHEPDVLPANP